MEGLTDVAREKLLEARNYSDDPLLVFGLAELDSELGNDIEAIKGYAQLDNRSIYQQTGISTYQRIGISYARLGKFESAIEFLEKAIELEYDDQVAVELASLYFDKEEYQKALLYFKTTRQPFLQILRVMSMAIVKHCIRSIRQKRLLK